MITCVFTPHAQRPGQRKSLCYRQPLKSGSKHQSHKAGRIDFGQPLELRGKIQSSSSRPFAQNCIERPIVSEQANRPRANVLVRILELGEQKILVAGADGIKRPQSPELDNRIALLREQLVQ